MNKISFSSIKFAKNFFLYKIIYVIFTLYTKIMWKKRFIISSILFTVWSYILNLCIAGTGMGLWNMSTIYNPDQTKVINTEYNSSTINNPIEDWARRVTPDNAWLVGTDETEITDYMDALGQVLHVIQNVVNYALWILSLVALIYLIIHGFMILTAAGDDAKMKKWLKWVKNAFIAIAWIWLSWIIISFILWLINYIAS